MSVPAAQRIGLGTAQFGLDYGITNSGGKVAAEEAQAILRLCEAAGVDTVDTACSYGDSEEVIGRCSPAGHLRIVTKTPKFGEAASPEADADRLERALTESLQRLGRSSIHGLLFHDPADLLGSSGPGLWRKAEDMKGQGLAGRIGVSIYERAEADALLDRYPIEIIQLPWNPIDSRLVRGGQLERLAAAGVEIHARSLFLQGLLLQPPARIPERFGLRDAVAELHQRCTDAGLSPLEGILAAAFRRGEISRFIVGVTSAGELREILLAAEKAQAAKISGIFLENQSFDEAYLNPSRWG